MRILLVAIFIFTSTLSHAESSLMTKVQGLKSDFVVVQVWSASCAPCGEEVSELNSALTQINKVPSHLKLAVLGVPVQSRKRDIAAFINHFQPKYEQWTPDASFLEEVSKENAVPWTLLYHFGKRIKEWRGKLDEIQLLAEIKELDKGN